jgi:hypothetical protein
MEPISTTIVAALVAGATTALKGVATQAVTDAYDGLKRIITDRYKRKAAIDNIEEDPESTSGQESLKEALDKTGAANDPEVIAKARSLTEALTALPQEAVAAAGLDIERFKAANAVFENIQASGTAVHMRDVEVGGTFEARGIRGGVKNE